MKTGANFEDRNAIQRYIAEGILDPNFIGQKINVEPRVVARFIEHYTKSEPDDVSDDDVSDDVPDDVSDDDVSDDV